MPKAVRGLVLACHPGPAAVVTVVAAVLAASVGYPLPRLAVLTAAMLADQLSVGWSNDAIDAGRDRAVARLDKPIAVGLVTRRAVTVAALIAFAAALSTPPAATEPAPISAARHGRSSA